MRRYGAAGGSRRRKHTTMVTKSEFREVVAARAEGRPLDPRKIVASANPADNKRVVSVLLADDELERLVIGREA